MEPDKNCLKNYQKSLFCDNSETASQKAEIQRKSSVQMFNNYSLETENEETTCHLLEQNLHKYHDISDSDQTKSNFLHNDRIKTTLEEHNIQTPVHLKSNLAKVDLKSMHTALTCYKTNSFKYRKSEGISQADVDLIELFRKKRKSELSIPKRRILANSCMTIMRSRSEEVPKVSTNLFKIARQEMRAQNLKNNAPSLVYGGQKHKLGIVPFLSLTNRDSSDERTKSQENLTEIDDYLKDIDPKMVELIKSEIMHVGAGITWDDIAGLQFAKTAIEETVVWPILRPDIFTGLRKPPKGILLFGPPGTGKTLIGKCVASESNSTFFSISASSLISNWVGNGEKMVRALFTVARSHQPAVIFIDEIDYLLSQRNESEHESFWRIKTEFLAQLDGLTTDSEERLLVIGATNKPQELDEAARRRFVKRLYIPLPENQARLQLVSRLISKERHNLSNTDLETVAKLSDGYSGADIRNLCSEASLGPIRSIDMSMLETIQAHELRPLTMDDFYKAFARVRSSVSPKDLEQYVVWNETYGSDF